MTFHTINAIIRLECFRFENFEFFKVIAADDMKCQTAVYNANEMRSRPLSPLLDNVGQHLRKVALSYFGENIEICFCLLFVRQNMFGTVVGLRAEVVTLVTFIFDL
jgi:hypothetical protein